MLMFFVKKNCVNFENFNDSGINSHELFTDIGNCKMLLSTQSFSQKTHRLFLILLFYMKMCFHASAHFNENINNRRLNCSGPLVN